MNITDAIAILDSQVTCPSDGLSQDLFYYISRTTPLVNVDLLIRDECNRTLLAWRNDQYTGAGWHVPGGILRFKETLEDRVRKVAETEVGTLIQFDSKPIAINQIIAKERNTRGHFISLLYRCSLSGRFVPENNGLSTNDPGYLRWHDVCPDDLLKWHEIYREFL